MKSEPLTAEGRPARKTVFRIVALLGVPLLTLSLLELGLRLGGYGYSTEFLVKGSIQGRQVLMDNQEFGKRFFPPGLVRSPRSLALPIPKPAKALRVFVFGESAAMGDPDPKYGFPRMLEAQLRERFPDRPVQVVNAGMVAINSHVIVSIARDCARADGDLWVIYMGNNEMIGPFGASSVFGQQAPPRAFVRAALALKTTRVGQLFDAVAHRLASSGPARLNEWGGMAMWNSEAIPPNGRAARRVYQNFRENLTEILDTGHRAGVPIILCTVATNLKDCGPFVSLHSARLTGAALENWEKLYGQALSLQSAGEWRAAAAAYERLAAQDDKFAEAAFRLGRCRMALGATNDVVRPFEAARDQDALPFRADHTVNQIIQEAALAYAPQGVRLLDAEKLFAQASSNSLPGWNFFYEHVHLNPEGNYVLARAVAERTARLLGGRASGLAALAAAAAPGAINSPSAQAVSPWLDEAQCLQRIGFTDWNRREILTRVLERIEQPPFTRQANHTEQVAQLREQLDQSRALAKPFHLERAARQVEAALQRDPEDSDLHWNLAQLRDTLDDVPKAEEQWRAVMRREPHAGLPRYNLGRLLESHGRADEALQLFEECLRLTPHMFEARLDAGVLLTRQGKLDRALPYLRQAVRQRPDSSEAHLALGVALAQHQERAAAKAQFTEALRLDPQNAAAQRQLANPELRPGP